MLTLDERMAMFVGRTVGSRLGCLYAIHAMVYGMLLAESLDGGSGRMFWCNSDSFSDCEVVA